MKVPLLQISTCLQAVVVAFNGIFNGMKVERCYSSSKQFDNLLAILLTVRSWDLSITTQPTKNDQWMVLTMFLNYSAGEFKGIPTDCDIINVSVQKHLLQVLSQETLMKFYMQNWICVWIVAQHKLRTWIASIAAFEHCGKIFFTDLASTILRSLFHRLYDRVVS